MRFASALCLLVLPTLVYGQTAEIQRQVETKLWFLRVLEWIEAVMGVPPAVALSTLFGILLALVAAVWWWLARPEAV